MHVIRLRGPWQLEPLARYVVRSDGSYDEDRENVPAGGTAKMPADWSETLGSDFRGGVRYRRSFQRPTGLQPRDTVWLVVEPPRSCATVHLAGRLLGGVLRFGGPAGRFDVTHLLDDRNRLEIVVQHPAPDGTRTPDDDEAPGGLVGEVRLEIEEGTGDGGQGTG